MVVRLNLFIKIVSKQFLKWFKNKKTDFGSDKTHRPTHTDS